MPDEDVIDILSRLGLVLINSNAEGWVFSVPSYRFDISIEADLLEELARVYGYNNLPVTSMAVPMVIESDDEAKLELRQLRNTLVARDYQEAICYSFVDEGLLKKFEPEAQPVPLQNPISADMSVMRTSLWPGLVSAMQYNLNRQQSRVRLFETGLRFVSPNASVDKLVQTPMIAGVICGGVLEESWHGKASSADFYDIKADVEALLDLGDSSELAFEVGSHPALHPGQTAQVIKNGVVIGVLGAIHPQLQKALGLSQPAYLFELEQGALIESQVPAFKPLSKFPEVRRDIAVIVDQAVAVANLTNVASKASGSYLQDLKVFDLYVGEGIDPHRKSVAMGLTFQHPSRTLTEDEINTSMEEVLKALGDEYNATLR
jgi:phenylalanyl-tRNA synthetase beta chain